MGEAGTKYRGLKGRLTTTGRLRQMGPSAASLGSTGTSCAPVYFPSAVFGTIHQTRRLMTTRRIGRRRPDRIRSFRGHTNVNEKDESHMGRSYCRGADPFDVGRNKLLAVGLLDFA